MITENKNDDIHILYEVLYVRVCRGISNPNNTYFKIIHKIKTILQETKPPQRQKCLCVGRLSSYSYLTY